MGIKRGPIVSCHGNKVGDELLLWADNVVGFLSDEQEKECDRILIENAKGGPKEFSSKKEALKADVGKWWKNTQSKLVKHLAKFKQMGNINDICMESNVDTISCKKKGYELLEELGDPEEVEKKLAKKYNVKPTT